MKINELIAEHQDIDEGIGSFLGKAAGHAVGGVSAAFRDAKQGYKDAKAVWDPKDPPGTYTNAAGVPSTGQTPPAAGVAPAADATVTNAPVVSPSTGTASAVAPSTDTPATGDISSIMKTIDTLDKPTKQQLAGELQKNIARAPEPATATATTAPATPGPAGTTYDPKKAAADKLAKGQADQQQAQQQMANTKQANAATNQQDAAIKSAADAAKAKSGFQQTAADKLAIKAAADKGIREAKEKKLKKKKKIVAEFHSNFLGKQI